MRDGSPHRWSEYTVPEDKRGPCWIPRLGSSLVVFALLVVLPFHWLGLYRLIGHYGRNWDARNAEFAQLVIAETRTRLLTYEEMSRRFTSSVDEACTAASLLGLDQELYAVGADGVQLCGPPVSADAPVMYRWLLDGGHLFHNVPTRDGGRVGAVVDPELLLHDAYGLYGLGVNLVDAQGRPLVSAPMAPERPVPEGGPGGVVTQVLPNSDVSVLVTLPDPYENDSVVWVVLAGVLSLVLAVVGLALCMIYPVRHLWRRVVLPDDMQILLVDSHGRARSATSHRFCSEAGGTPAERLAPDGQTELAALLRRARDGEAMANAVFASQEGSRVRLTVLGWLPFPRRHVVLRTPCISDPIVDVVSEPANLAFATVVGPDDRVLYTSNETLNILQLDRPFAGEQLLDLLEQPADGKLSSLMRNSRARPYLILSGLFAYRWRLLSTLMFTDEHDRLHLWLQDVTQRLHGVVLRDFLHELREYLATPHAPRPDVTTLRRQLDPSPHRRPSAPIGELAELEQHTVSMLDDIRDVIRFADRIRLAESGVSEMRLSAARRREFARRLHDDVVQGLVSLRWYMGEDEQANALCDLLLVALRRIIEEIRVPPWEQRLAPLLDAVVEQARVRGVAVARRVDLPQPVPYEILSTVTTVARESIANALKHGDPQEITLDLRQIGGNRLLLIISDDSTSGSRNGTGTGYGHQLCRDLAEEYQGSFGFDTTPEGHVVRLMLPFVSVGDEGVGQ